MRTTKAALAALALAVGGPGLAAAEDTAERQQQPMENPQKAEPGSMAGMEKQVNAEDGAKGSASRKSSATKSSRASSGKAKKKKSRKAKVEAGDTANAGGPSDRTK